MTPIRHRHGVGRGPIHAPRGCRTAISRSKIRHGRRHDEIPAAPKHSPGRKSSYGARSWEGMAVSLRRIMSEARVNIAAIHYHFGDRQALIDALVDRRLGTVNGARLKRLAEARERSDPAGLEDIVQAFMGPSVEASLSADSGWQHFSRFLVWLVNDPQTTSRTLLKNVYGELHPRFQAAFRNRLPHLSATTTASGSIAPTPIPYRRTTACPAPPAKERYRTAYLAPHPWKPSPPWRTMRRGRAWPW